MKKIVSLILTLICGFGLVACNKGVETMYVEGIVVNGVFYEKSYQPMPAEVDDSAIIGYIESYTDTVPKKDGETNISKDLVGAPYAEVEGGIALLYKNEWYLCSPMEEATGAPLAPEETDMDLESVSHIEVMSGLTGKKITVKDNGSVQRVMDDIESLRYKKKGAVEEVGYAYRIRFYNENYDELGRIFITEENGHQISYDGYYYLVEANQNINVDYLEELLKDAPPAEPGDEGNDELPDREVTEVIAFHDKVFNKSDLSEETIKWLENYNSLSEEEQLSISSIPAELYELCGYPTAEAMEAMDETLEFSYEEDSNIYLEGIPGVKTSQFVNVSEVEINSKDDAVEQAKKECTVKWYTVKVYYDKVASIWKIVFSDEGVLGGDQTVYMNDKGETILIVYGE